MKERLTAGMVIVCRGIGEGKNECEETRDGGTNLDRSKLEEEKRERSKTSSLV